MGSGASHLKYVKEVIREEESSVEDVKEAFEKLPPDAMAELRACCRAMDELEVCFQPSENKHSSTSPAKQKRPTKPASSAPEAASYSLEKRKDLARFLDEADIRLVRAEYLWHLVESKKKAPARRQEAEKVGFTLDGSRYGCHVDKDEVEQWGAGEVEALVCSVSHCWESKEHADPTGYQIKVLASAAALYAAAYGHSVWLFLDFLSLHQFKRTSEEQEVNFRKAMANMHILYAHECTITLRIENLAPDSSWDSGKVCVYQKGDDGVKDLRPQRLDRNSTEYRQRGWCQSELSWSCMRSTMPSCHQVDSHLNPGESVNLHVEEKVRVCKSLVVGKIDRFGINALTQSLEHFANLESLVLYDFTCGLEEAKKLCTVLERMPKDHSLKKTMLLPADPQSEKHLKTARNKLRKPPECEFEIVSKQLDGLYDKYGNILKEFVAERQSSLRPKPQIPQLVEMLQENSAPVKLELDVTEADMQALARVLKYTCSLKELILSGSELESHLSIDCLIQGLEGNEKLAEEGLEKLQLIFRWEEQEEGIERDDRERLEEAVRSMRACELHCQVGKEGTSEDEGYGDEF